MKSDMEIALKRREELRRAREADQQAHKVRRGDGLAPQQRGMYTGLSTAHCMYYQSAQLTDVHFQQPQVVSAFSCILQKASVLISRKAGANLAMAELAVTPRDRAPFTKAVIADHTDGNCPSQSDPLSNHLIYRPQPVICLFEINFRLLLSFRIARSCDGAATGSGVCVVCTF